MKTLIILVAACFSASVCAQAPSSLVPGRTWSSNTIPKSPAQVNSAWSGVVDGVTWWVNMFAEASVRSDVKPMVDASLTEIARDLAWTGEGGLVHVRLIQRNLPGTDLVSYGILGDRAWLAASARTPEEALFEYSGKPQLAQAPPEGWVEHPFGSSYFWVTLDARGQPHASVVPRGVPGDLQKRLRENFGQVALESYRRSWTAGDRWVAIGRTARLKLSDQAAKRAVDETLASIEASSERVAALDASLRSALIAEQHAAAALNKIRLLQGILTVAQLVQEVRSTMNEAVPELSTATDATSVTQVTESVARAKQSQRASTTLEFNSSLTELQKNLDRLRLQAKEAGAPGIIDQKLQIQVPRLM